MGLEDDDGTSVKITVLTAAGSPHLDVRCRLELPGSATVGDIKAALAERMAGKPPPSAQRLVFGTRALESLEETIAEVAAPPPRSYDEFDDEADEDGGFGDGAAAVRELSLVMDIVPPLAADKSVPAALEAKLKAYAAEVVAVRALSNRLADAMARAGGGGVAKGRTEPGGAEEGGAAEGAEHAASEPSEVLETAGLREEIRVAEAHILGMVAGNLTARKSMVHSAVAEDGRVPQLAGLRVGGARAFAATGSCGGDAGDPGAWKRLQRACAINADVAWKDTLRTAGLCLLLAKFGAHGPQVRSRLAIVTTDAPAFRDLRSSASLRERSLRAPLGAPARLATAVERP